jgi:ribosomal protein L11 methyltransferase
MYQRWVLGLQADDEEALAALLWQAGTLGFETRRASEGELLVEAFFAEGGPGASVSLEVELARMGVDLRAVEWIEERDWLAPFRSSASRFELGARFLVDPREPEDGSQAADGSRLLLRIPARNAFGVGTHESTRLAVDLLESLPLEGKRVLDFGSGSGILCFCALQLGAFWALGVEHDWEAALTADENRHLNGLQAALVASDLGALQDSPFFDVIVANMLPVNLLPNLAGLARLLRHGGHLLLSGFLSSQRGEVVEAAGDCGLRAVRESRLGEWSALEVQEESS